ncbi:MAG: PIG-L deacetylase family protein [Thermodesulfobacteriota bacterium]
MKKKRILAIGAHPDDIEFGCAGTLINCTDKGHEVALLLMTKGGQGGGQAVREAEQEKALDVMGVKSAFWAGYQDTRIPLGREPIERIEEVLRQVKPEVIFCSFFDDTHQDHRNMAHAVMSATRYVPNVLFYEGPTTQNFNPHVFTDIEKNLDRKMEALRAHASQVMKTNIAGISILEMAHSCANFRGIQARVKFAEAFYAQRYFADI